MDPTKSFLLRHQDSDGGDNESLLPVLYRIYKGSVQRQVPNFQALSSHAAFLILLDSESQVVGWIGSQCGEEDSNILQELGIEVMTRDYSHTNITSIPIVYENDDLSPLVESFLDILDIDSSLYYNKLSAAERRKPIENNSISIGLLIPPKNLKDSSLFELRETSFAHPDGNGTVPRIPFPPIEKTSIVYMSVGDQWDLWFSRNLPDVVVDASIKFVENLIETQITRTLNVQKQNNKPDQSISSLILQYFVITNQGQERQCFRRALKIFTDFEPFEDLQTILNRRNEQKEQQLLQRQKKQTNTNANNKNDQKGNLESKDDEEKEDDLALRVTQDFTETNRGKLNNSPSFKLGKQSSTMRPQMSMRGGDMSHVVKSDFWTANNPNAPNHNAPLRSNSLNPLKSNSFNESSNALLFQPITMRPNDVYAITLELIELREQENVPLKDRRNLLQESCKNPDILLGWQVEIDDGIYSGVFVIIGTKKSPFRKTFFHLCAGPQDEFWVRLKRSNSKRGIMFRPLRQVAFIDANGPLDFDQSYNRNSNDNQYHPGKNNHQNNQDDDLSELTGPEKDNNSRSVVIANEPTYIN